MESVHDGRAQQGGTVCTHRLYARKPTWASSRPLENCLVLCQRKSTAVLLRRPRPRIEYRRAYAPRQASRTANLPWARKSGDHDIVRLLTVGPGEKKTPQKNPSTSCSLTANRQKGQRCVSIFSTSISKQRVPFQGAIMIHDMRRLL